MKLNRITLLISICFILFNGCKNINSNKEPTYFYDYYEGLNYCKKQAKCDKILLVFNLWATSNFIFENNIRKAVKNELLDNYTIIYIRVDDKMNNQIEFQRKKYKCDYQPVAFIITPNEKILKGPLGYSNYEEFIKFIN